MANKQSENECPPQPLNARRIRLDDGRYMIFFEFDEAETDTVPSAAEASEQPKQSVKSDV